jgi:hypothetical protein
MNKENLRRSLILQINKELNELTRRRKKRSNFKRAQSAPYVLQLAAKINQVGVRPINVSNNTPIKLNPHLPKSQSAPSPRKLNFR